ncbi:hypothetical protein CsatB_010732 [Cannabis sativa]
MMMRKLSNNPLSSPMSKYHRFNPTDTELIAHLKLKIDGERSKLDDYIAEIDVCNWEPWELPAKSMLKSDIYEWWFLCRLDYKYSKNSKQVKRSTKTGYWKRTGEERKAKGCTGMKRNLVFYKGRKRTDWVIHEYYYPQPHINLKDQKPTCVICRLMCDPQRKGRNSDVSSVFPEEGLGEVNHPPVSPIPSPDANFLEQALGFMPDNDDDMQVSYGENCEISGKTTSDLENPWAVADNNPFVKYDNGASCRLPATSDFEIPSSSVVIPVDHCYDNNSPIYSPHSNFIEQTWSSPFDKDMQTPSGAADELNEYYGKLPYLSVGHPPLGLGDIWSCPDLRHVQTEEVNKQVERYAY